MDAPRAAPPPTGTHRTLPSAVALAVAVTVVFAIAAALAPHGAAGPAGADWSWAIPALFGSAVVASVAGFAFSAIALATAGWFFRDPVLMIATFLACSIAMQACAVWELRAHVEPRTLAPFVAGGLVGTPAGTALLLHVDARPFAALLGALLVGWCVFMLVRRPGARATASRRADLVAGLLGGVTGGLAAFPGAVPVAWIGLRGWPKERQRGLFQPYILLMQMASLASLAAMGHVDARLAAVPLGPPLLAAAAAVLGARIGLRLFARLGDRGFARWVLACLAASGLALIWKGLGG